mgnify:FL=1
MDSDYLRKFYREKRTANKVAIIGGGKSLDGVDFDKMKRHNQIICVNDAWRGFRDPHSVFSIDCSEVHKRFHDCPYDIYLAATYHLHVTNSISHRCFLRMDNPCLSEERYAIHHNENSGFGAFNFAYHFRPQYIFLFGIDLVNMGTYWHDHSDIRIQKDHVHATIPSKFNMTMRQIKKAGISVFNCSPISAIDCFRKVTPEYGVDLWNRLEE